MESTERGDLRDVRAYQPFPRKRRINSVDSDHESPYTPENASSSNHAKQFHSMETELVTYITDLHDKRPCCASKAYTGKGADERSF